MAWYYGTYSCGHEGRVNIIGPVKHRQRKADWHFSGLCPDCWKQENEKKKEAEYERVCQLAKEMELPELEGTEKQIRWAMVIRQNMLDEITKHEGWEIKPEKFDEVMDYFIASKTKASWFIDNRYDTHLAWMRIIKEYAKILEEGKTAELEEQAKIEATVYPENATTHVVAEIKILDNKVTVVFERNEKFREIVRALGYTWSGKEWEREITATTGSAEDRAAELGNKLLNAGIPIRIMDNVAREKAINGTYEPEHKRWIYCRKTGQYEGWLSIIWTDGSDLYDKARRLPRSKWSKPAVVVQPIYFDEIEEFARLYDFKFTAKAMEIIEKAKAVRAAAQVVTPAKVEEKPEKDGLQEILHSEADILDDLKD